MLDKKHFIGLFFLGLLLFFSIVVVFQGISEKERKNFWTSETKEIKIGENIFQTEIAASAVERRQGLSGREELCENCAMLFLFNEKGWHSFWMKEMKFDLDILWIDKNEIVHIAKNVSRKKEREIIKPNYEADKVLEINAGLADKLGIKTGDRIEF
jgi:uncharacterized membrane protein (UPF0127 family)